jgi:hypothetical protein
VSLTQARTKGKAIERLLEIAEERLDVKRMAEVAIVDIDIPKRVIVSSRQQVNVLVFQKHISQQSAPLSAIL